MATVIEMYEKVFGKEPSPELETRLSLIKNKLQIDDNDSIWSLLMGVGSLSEIFVKIPNLIDSQIQNLNSLFSKYMWIIVAFFTIIFIFQFSEYKNLISKLDYHINENKILTEQLVKLNSKLDLIANNYYNNNNYEKNKSLSNPTINTNSNQYNNIVPSPNNYNNNNNYRQDNNLSNPTINIDPNKYNNIFPNTNNNFNNR